MTRVHGDLWLVTDDPAGVNQVVVRAPDLRTRDGGAVTTLPKTEPVTDGKIDITVLPGPAYLTPISYGRHGEAIPIVVPDAESATLESVIQAAEIADTTQRDILEEIAAQITADREAVAADRQVVAQAKSDAAASASSATASKNAAASSAVNAATSAANASSSASAAAGSASTASTAASTATTAKNNAASSATAAAGSATTAGTAATTAVDKAAEAIDAADRAEQATSGKADIGHTHTKYQITDLPTVTSVIGNGYVVARETSGQINVHITPANEGHAASKSYVDNQVSDRITPDTAAMMISQAIAGLVGSAPQALDTVYELAAYLTDPGIASGLVQQLAGKSDTGHKHTPADVNASFAAQGNTIPLRDSAGRLAAASPNAPGQVATKYYVDSRPALFSGAGDPPSTIEGAVVGDYWLNEATMELSKITGV